MADPLSITASIISVLQLASCAGGYLRDVKNASKECKSLMLELSNTRGILETLKDTLAEIQEVENWSATLKMLGQRGGTLRQLETVLQDLNTRLSKTASAPGFKKLTKSLIWPFDKVKTEDVIKLIERQKSLLVLALDNDHIRLSESIKEDTIGIRHELTKVQEEVQVAVGGIQKLESREKGKASPSVRKLPQLITLCRQKLPKAHISAVTDGLRSIAERYFRETRASYRHLVLRKR
jgi:hypothetical protein